MELENKRQKDLLRKHGIDDAQWVDKSLSKVAGEVKTPKVGRTGKVVKKEDKNLVSPSGELQVRNLSQKQLKDTIEEV